MKWRLPQNFLLKSVHHTENTVQKHLSVFVPIVRADGWPSVEPQMKCGLISTGWRWTECTTSQTGLTHSFEIFSPWDHSSGLGCSSPHSRQVSTEQKGDDPVTRLTWLSMALSLSSSKQNICLCINSVCIWYNELLVIWGIGFLLVMKGRRHPLGVRC